MVYPIGNQMEWSFHLEHYRKKRIPSEVSHFSRFAGIIGISLYHLLHPTIAKLLGEIRGFSCYPKTLLERSVAPIDFPEKQTSFP